MDQLLLTTIPSLDIDFRYQFFFFFLRIVHVVIIHILLDIAEIFYS